jgi:ketosteroid isomerase-like protein
MTDPRQVPREQTELEDFIGATEEGVRHQVRGDSDRFLALWSRADDIAILGAIGTYARGWDDVRAHVLGAARSLDWTSLEVERLVTQVADGLAVSVVLEHMTRETGDPSVRTLRVTHAFRREHGRWRIVLRHANLVTAEAEAQERSLLGH